MSDPTTAAIAVTGATGQLGGRVARLLADAGIPLRLLVRDPSRAPGLPASTVHVAPYADAGAATGALAGVDVLFMVSASESEDRRAEHEAFVAAAQSAGVRHVVYTSFLGASPAATFTLARTHAATERAIAASGMAYTFLQDSFYMDMARAVVGEDGVIRGPAGHGRCAFVAHDDVARTAAHVLQAPARHAGRTYRLTGPQALAFDEVARIISEVEGTEVHFHDESVEEAYESRRAWNPPPWQADAWVSTYTAIARGELDVVSGDVEAVTGTAPMTFREFLQHRG
ncbi:MAG: family oxidoreductase [Citricoccus sp.]|jgi:NAD(P)H dehydrogenase (quinone)|nr:family oxidoreductase [Citricoccus sp. WCRC_4]